MHWTLKGEDGSVTLLSVLPGPVLDWLSSLLIYITGVFATIDVHFTAQVELAV